MLWELFAFNDTPICHSKLIEVRLPWNYFTTGSFYVHFIDMSSIKDTIKCHKNCVEMHLWIQFLFAVLANQKIQIKNCAAIECYFIAVAHEFVRYNQLAQAEEIKVIRMSHSSF